jgi:hypothetical protein
MVSAAFIWPRAKAAARSSMSALLKTIRSAISTIPLLDRLQVVAGVRQLQQHEDVDHAGDRRFGLPDADRLDDDHVETGRFADQHRFTRLVGHPAQRAGRRARPDEGFVALAQQLHARLVAEDRTS